MGIVCWQCGETRWAAPTTDANADHNSALFQLQLGSFPNREMQKLFTAQPEAFTFSLIRTLKYDDAAEDHADDLRLLMMDLMDEYPDVKPLKPGQKLP